MTKPNEDKKVSRRKFLAAAGGAVVAVAAAGGAYYYLSQAPTPPPSTTTAPPTTAASTVPSGPVAINYFGGNWGTDEIKLMMDTYTAANPGTTFNWTVIPWTSYHDKMVTVMSTVPEKVDCVTAIYPDFPLYVGAKWITPTDDMPGVDDFKNSLIEGAAADCTYNGHFYGAGAYFTGEKMFIYNERMIKAAGFDGPPTTLDELRTQALALKKAKIVDFPIAYALGIRHPPDLPETWNTLTLAIGGKDNGKLFDKNYDPLFLDPNSPGYRALEFLVNSVITDKIMSPSAMGWTDDDCGATIAASNSAFTIGHTYYLTDGNNPKISKEAGNIKLGYQIESKYTLVRNMYHYITTTAANKGKKEAVWKWLQYFGGPIGCKRWMVDKGLAEPIAALYSDPDVQTAWSSWVDSKLLGDIFQNWTVNHAFINPIDLTTFAGEWAYTQAGPILQQALLGQLDVPGALQQIATATAALLKEYGYTS